MDCHRRLGYFLSGCVLFLITTPTLYATELDEIRQLAGTGAVNLALRIIEQEQQALSSDPDKWMQWEQQRIALMVERRDWQGITSRLESMPSYATADYIMWARYQRAQALVALGDGNEARKELRTLIWAGQQGADIEKKISQWRRLIIQSYLSDGLADDAQVATLRFQQEYGEQQEDILLRARIAILNGQTDVAITTLKPMANDPRAGALLLLAQLRGQTRSSQKIMQAVMRHLRNKEIDNELRINLWAVGSEAAQRAGQSDFACNAFEHVLAEKKLLSLPAAIIDINSDTLWNAYLEYALMLGNRNHLLIGQDDKWLAYAESVKRKRPVGARALNVFVMMRGQTEEARLTAANHFVESIKKRKHGKHLLQTLFAESKHYPTRARIPLPAKHVLVDIALANSNIDLASEIMATIQEPPSGSDQFMWKLRRARILVLGTQMQAGIAALNNMLDENTSMQQLQVDRFMQVIFDLQTAGEHAAAYQLFDKIMPRTDDEKIRREIYFWMADSRKAQEEYADAARLYLKSAMYPDPENRDPWAQTAYYQAAVALSQGGIYEDSQVLFEFLLRVTDDPSRQAVLKNELQKLWAKH